MDSKNTKVGTYNPKFNSILGLHIEAADIYQSEGLKSHIIKRNHFKALKYFDKISEIISAPDYVGTNPNEKNDDSIELIKKYDDNILLGIKLDKSGDYLYVSTMYDVQESKITRRLNSGRLKAFSD